MLSYLTRGQNVLLKKTFVNTLEEPINYADMTAFKVQLKQGQNVLLELVKGTSSSIRQGATADEVEIELTPEITNQLKPFFHLKAVYWVTTQDVDFDIDEVSIDTIEEIIAHEVK